MIAWYIFPLFFTMISTFVVLAATIMDRVANRYAGQEIAHIIVWLVMVIINLAFWLVILVVRK